MLVVTVSGENCSHLCIRLSHLSAVLADEGPLPRVDAVVDVEVALARVRLPAHAAHPRLLPRVRPHVLLQRVVVVARLMLV